MKRRTGDLYIRKLIIVDDMDQVIHKVQDVSVKKGIATALSIIEKKDGTKTVRKILHNFSKFLDDEFKSILGMGEDDEKD